MIGGKRRLLFPPYKRLCSIINTSVSLRPTDFSLIIADESHRSINGNSRAVFEYFLGYKLGLTATPKDYIKNISCRKAESY